MFQIRQLLFRPARAPSIVSPLTVRSAGRYRFRSDAVRNPPRGFSQLFWVSEGTVSYLRNARSWQASGGDVFYFRADEPHCVRAANAFAEYRWITFDGPFVSDWLDTKFPGFGPRRVGPCPVALFDTIQATLTNPAPAAEKQAAELGLRLLIQCCDYASAAADGESSHKAALCHALESMIEAGFADPDFGVEYAARQLGCHRSTLFRIYREQRGITPSAFLQRLRIQQAMAQLRAGKRSIAEIALRCGFRDPNYFAKVIRRATGETPRRIRAAHPAPF